MWAERWTLASTVVFVFSRCYGLTALRPGTGLHSGLSGTGGSGVVSFVPAGWCAVEPGDGQAGRLCPRGAEIVGVRAPPWLSWVRRAWALDAHVAHMASVSTAALPAGPAAHGSPRVRGMVSMRVDGVLPDVLPVRPLPWMRVGGRSGLGLRALQGGGAGAGPRPVSDRLRRKFSQSLKLHKVSLDPHC